MTGFASGAINAMVHDDPSLVLKGAAGGAISGIRTAMHNAIFGAGYQPQDENGKPVSYGADGVYRKGGLAQYFPGGGLTLGRYAYINEKGQSKKKTELDRFHENAHIQQENGKGGYIRFYRGTLNQYSRFGYHKSYITSGTLEWGADDYVESRTGYNMHKKRIATYELRHRK